MTCAGMTMRSVLRVNGTLVLRRAVVLRSRKTAVILMLGRVMKFFFRRMHRPGDRAQRPHGCGEKRNQCAIWIKAAKHCYRVLTAFS